MKNLQANATKCAKISNMFGGALAASTSPLPVEVGGEVAGSEKQKQHTDRVREEAKGHGSE